MIMHNQAYEEDITDQSDSPIVTARLLSLVRYSTHGATVNPEPSNRTRCLIGTDTLGPNALALASS